MTETPITINMDPNEMNSLRALAIRRVVIRHPERWLFDFRKIDLDLKFSLGNRDLWWEIKTAKDLARSLAKGHMMTQKMFVPGSAQIIVLGTYGDVLRASPEIMETNHPSDEELARADEALTRWVANLFAAGMPVHFGFTAADFPHLKKKEAELAAHDKTLAHVCRMSRAYLLEDWSIPKPKAESWPLWCLLGLKNVGPTRAKSLLESGIHPRLKTGKGEDVLMVEDLLAPGVGKKTAASVLEEVLRSSDKYLSP